MKKILLILIAVALGFGLYVASVYNALISYSQQVQSNWAQVQNVYQRRADLIPNLVATVKGYAAHEKQTLEGVIKARATATQVTANVNLSDAAQFKQLEQAQQSLSSALSRLLLVVERYPDLKANQNFLALQAELAGTENRIVVERRRFNIGAQAYNIYLQRFPHNIIASWFAFKPMAYFTAETNAQSAPRVDFGS